MLVSRHPYAGFVALAAFGACLAVTRPSHAQTCPSPRPLPNGAPCYVVFVHGAGTDDTAAPDYYQTWSSHGPGTSESYWWPDRAEYNDPQWSFTFRGSGQHLPGMECAIARARYDGHQSFWAAASQVAAELNNFYCNALIDFNQNNVILVAHSMGGLIVRWILNHGVNPQDGYYSPAFNSVVRNTKYAITVQTPHTGAKTADALWGESEDEIADAVGSLAVFFGVRDRDDASYWMQRSLLEVGSASGGWMGDDNRTRNLFTIGSDSVADDASEDWDGFDEDDGLKLVWQIVHGSDSGGDGLVERYSAQGFNPATNNWIPGPMWTWIDVKANHNHGRYDVHFADTWDWLRNELYWDTLGTYIGQYGMNLPWSAIDHSFARN